METLTAASMAALTLYDMLKPHTDPEHLWIADCRLPPDQQDRRQITIQAAAAVIVLSDTVAAGKKPDTAGDTTSEGLMDAGFEVANYRVVPDDPDEVEAAIRAPLDAAVPLIVTVGSTGLGERDCAVEVAGQLINREIPGLMEPARAFGQRAYALRQARARDRRRQRAGAIPRQPQGCGRKPWTHCSPG